MSPFRPGDRVIVLPGRASAVVISPDVALVPEVPLMAASRGVLVRRESGRLTTVPVEHVLLDPDPDPEEAA